MLVGTDYFTKWVEAEPLANIRDVDAKKFLWKNIVTCFGVPNTLVSDNGLQFDSKSFRRYCGELGITNNNSTSAYPQGNGQVEPVNKVIVNGLKKRLDDAKGRKIKREERKRITVASTLINSEFNNNSSPRTTISSSFISISMLVYSEDPY